MGQWWQQKIHYAPADVSADVGGDFPSRAPDPILKAHEPLLRSPRHLRQPAPNSKA